MRYDHRMRRLRQVAAGLVVVLCGTIPATCAAAASASPRQQMACCKSGHRSCGKAETAADCCKRMRHGAPHAATATLPSHATVAAPPAAMFDGRAPSAASIEFHPSTISFKRPHDPPHLHPVALLI